MAAEDARLALEHGVDVIYVSNHGGRQLDHGLGAIDVLPEVVDAVSGRSLVAIDGGFSRGTDIIKGIALGADFVGIGRMLCYGLAAAGADGVIRMLELLEEEVKLGLGLLGANNYSVIEPSQLCSAAPTVEPSVVSAFPLLETDKFVY